MSGQGSEYINFDIQVGPVSGRRYPISAQSNSGQTKEPSWNILPRNGDFTDLFVDKGSLVGQRQDTEVVGRLLGQFLFPQPVRELFVKTITEATTNGNEGIRVRLQISVDQIELHKCPWEYIQYDNSFMALKPSTPFVRYIPTTHTPTPVETPAPVKVLLVTANPKDQHPLRLTSEIDAIRGALTELHGADRIMLRELPEASRSELRNTIREFQPHVLHFAGHGAVQPDGEGLLILQDTEGYSEYTDARSLLYLLQASSVKLVVLSACDTASPIQNTSMMGVAPKLIEGGIPAVIGMQFPVPDKTAVVFSQELYNSLAIGKPLDRAMTDARFALYFDYDDKVFWGIPVLYLRAPDGVIWRNKRPTREEESQTETEPSGNIRGKSSSIADLERKAIDLLLNLDGIEDREVRIRLFRTGFKRSEYLSILQPRTQDLRVEVIDIVKLGTASKKLDAILRNAQLFAEDSDLKGDLQKLEREYLKVL